MKFMFRSSAATGWFKLRKREYGPAGTSDQQWVLVKKRAGGSIEHAAAKKPKKTKKGRSG